MCLVAYVNLKKQRFDSLERSESWVVVTNPFHIPNHKKNYICIYIKK